MKFCIVARTAQRKCALLRAVQEVMRLICIIGDVNLDYSTKVMTGKILACKFTIVPFIMTKYFRGENLRL